MTQRIRCFAAIEISGSIKSQIEKILYEFSSEFSDCVKWITENNIHLTLKFLKDFNYLHVRPLENEMKQKLCSIPIFQIKSRQIGFFPSAINPRIVWLGITAPPQIKIIYDEIENITSTYGYHKENRSFTPHVTIGRIRNTAGKGQLLKLIDKVKSYSSLLAPASMDVQEIALIKSTLTPQGPKYEQLFKIRLFSKNGLC